MNRYPKLIPWFARKAGVSVELAEKLWRRASCEGRELAGDSTSSAFFSLTMDRFLDLLDKEARSDLDCASQYNWVWRQQRRMLARSFGAASLTYRWWDQVWQHMRARTPRMLA